MGHRTGGRSRFADHLAAVVDAQSCAGGATGEGAEVDHCPVFKQESVPVPARGVRTSDHLAAVVDARSCAEVATWEGAEVGHDPVFKQKRVLKPARGVRKADYLAAV